MALSALSAIVNADANPFVSQEVISGYQVAESNAGLKAEGRCGEAKCGANATDKANVSDKLGNGNEDKHFKAEGRCGEAKCGANATDKANVSDKPGKGNSDKHFKAEGRCGEGKCGANASDKLGDTQ